MDITSAFFLYVEDDVSSRTVFSLYMNKVLQTDNYLIFSDSSNFLKRVNALSYVPDVFLLDIHVKPFNGFEMIDMLHHNEKFRNSKIVAVTASVMNEEIEKLRNKGFFGAIGKPIRLNTFPHLLAQVVNGVSVWQI